MKLDSVIEIICQAFSEKFDGIEYNAKSMTIEPPTNHSQAMTVIDFNGNTYRIEVSKV
jgi:hypothetical protein